MRKLGYADLEADNLLDDATQVWCGVFKDAETGEVFSFYPSSHPNFIEAMLDHMDEYESLVMHNGIGYDWPLLEKLYSYEYKGKKIDSLLMSRLYKPNRRSAEVPKHPHSVEAWGHRLGVFKKEHEDWSQFSMDMLERCRKDVEIQEKIYNTLLEEAAPHNWSHATPLTMKLFDILRKQAAYGWLVDQDHMHDCIRKLDRWIYRIDRAVIPRLPMKCIPEETKVKGEYKFVSKPFKKNGEYSSNVQKWMAENGYESVEGVFSRLSFRPVNLNSGDELKAFLLSIGWEPAEWNMKDGQRTSPKLNKDDPFHGVQGSLGRLVAKRVQCRHRKSTIEGWFKAIRPDGRISGVVTGLAATGRAKHAVIVNVPGTDAFFGKEMRKCFIAKEGYKIVGVDSAGCQNRMLAARVNDEFFTKTLLEGKKEDKSSIHYVNQFAINKLVNERFPSLNFSISYHDSKTCNYATLFGASGRKVGSSVNQSSEVGDTIKEAIFGVAPGFQGLIDKLSAEWKATAIRKYNVKFNKLDYADGYITGLDGRPVFVESEHALLVYLLQSDEAIMMSTAYCLMYKWMEQRGYVWGKDWGYVAFIHDELQIECREEIVEDVAKLGELAIVKAGEYFNIACPHKGESDIGDNWYETH